MLSISAILSAVPPRDQSDQYVILAAMYSLDAQSRSVTAKQIREVLSLQLGKKIPKNISDCLRKYKAYVEAAEKGPPLRWDLTPKGVDHLRALSGLALSTASTAADFDYDVGIVCALEQPELDAVVKAMGGSEKWSAVGTARYSHLYTEKPRSRRQLAEN